VKQLERRLIKLEREMPPASPSLPADSIGDAFARIWTTLAIAGLGNPRPDEPLRCAWARVVKIEDRGRRLSQRLIAIIGGSRAYPGSELDIAILRDATNSVPAWLDSLACLNVARKALHWPLRDVGNDADPMTPAATLDLIGSWSDIGVQASWDREIQALSDGELKRLIAVTATELELIRARIAEIEAATAAGGCDS
jgi:hypothetical protein